MKVDVLMLQTEQLFVCTRAIVCQSVFEVRQRFHIDPPTLRLSVFCHRPLAHRLTLRLISIQLGAVLMAKVLPQEHTPKTVLLELDVWIDSLHQSQWSQNLEQGHHKSSELQSIYRRHLVKVIHKFVLFEPKDRVG